MSEDGPESTNVHSPWSSGNSKFQFLSTPGPKLVTPSTDWYLRPSLVMIETSNPPIGTGASLAIETTAWITSSSSSLMSILISRISALREPFFPEVEAAMSPTHQSTIATILEGHRVESVYLSPPRVVAGSDQSTAATVWFDKSTGLLFVSCCMVLKTSQSPKTTPKYGMTYLVL